MATSGTVIVSSGLQHHEVVASLSNQRQRIRFSDSVVDGSIIFPLSGVAFIIVDVEDLFDNSAGRKLTEQIERFAHIHRNSFLLLVAALFGSKEWDILYKLQQRFLGDNLRIIPVHNVGDMVKSMVTIATATCKPHVDSVRNRIAMARAQIIEYSPVWEMLRKQQK